MADAEVAHCTVWSSEVDVCLVYNVFLLVCLSEQKAKNDKLIVDMSCLRKQNQLVYSMRSCFMHNCLTVYCRSCQN